MTIISTQTPSVESIKQSVEDLQQLLKIKTTMIGMKLFESEKAMASIPKIRRPKKQHTADQIVGMAARLGWTLGITAKDLVGDQCRGVLGLAVEDPQWLDGKRYVGIWHASQEDAAARQAALD
ncbi:MAG: DUF169 domain-containing protein, partial [Burkholderiaceae bacterium]